MALKGKRDLKTFKLIYAPDPADKRYLKLFAARLSYSFLGLFPTDRHLIGSSAASPSDALFLLGTDQLGRDFWSRLMLATRTSLIIGLVGVTISACSSACCWAASRGSTAAGSTPSSSA